MKTKAIWDDRFGGQRAYAAGVKVLCAAVRSQGLSMVWRDWQEGGPVGHVQKPQEKRRGEHIYLFQQKASPQKAENKSR